MRSRTATWFECKIAFEKVMENGLQKKVTEKYVVNALSHSEAEERIKEEMSAYISGEFEVKGIVPAQYKEIFFMSVGEKMVAGQTEDLLHAVKKGDRKKGMEVYERGLEDYPTDSRWYKVRLQFLTIDEKSGKEKRTHATYLVQGASVNNAARNTAEALQGTMKDYVITSVAEQPIIDVFEMTAAETKAAAEKVAKKATTRKTAPKATVTVEAAGRQFDITAIADKAVAAYKAMNEKAAVKTVDVYVKPEEGVAYYVINGEGSADFKVEL